MDTINQAPAATYLASLFSSQASGDSKTTSARDPLQFQQMMALMSGSSMNDSLGSGSFSMGLLAPLFLTLMEKLIQLQMDLQANESTPASPSSAEVPAEASTAAADPLAASAGFGTTSPRGRPTGGYVTQYFHSGHNGIDFGVPIDTPIHATMDGKVVYAGWNNEGYGNLVIVENGPYRTFYAHLNSIPVSYGQEVGAGSVVGLSGTTGNSTGPHLHYEVRNGGQVIDPTSFTL